jgi:hypothetical protein
MIPGDSREFEPKVPRERWYYRFVRCWTTSDGRLLVEEKAGVYLLLSADGRLDTLFATGQGSESEHLYSTSYSVAEGELRLVFTDENTDSGRTFSERTSELKGLTPARVVGIEDRVRRLLERP